MSQMISKGLPRLVTAGWLNDERTRAVFGALGAQGHEVRAVGGAVRNALLNRPVGDVDLATTAQPSETIAAAEKAGLKSVPTGIEHGTVTIVSGGKPYEVTTLREDVETFGRHAEVAFTTDWAADASRRDFTVNALYADAEGHVFDPLGGYCDLQARRIRFIGDPGERIREDYLRILRFFRFNAEIGEGPIDQDGLDACVIERRGIDRLSGERVRVELFRLLKAEHAWRTIETMFDYGLLVLTLGRVPALCWLKEVIKAENVLSVSPNPVRRLGALAALVMEDAELLTGRLRLSRAEALELSRLAEGMCLLTSRSSEHDARAALYSLGAVAYQDCVVFGLAQEGAGGNEECWRGLAGLPQRWTAPQFPLSGRDVQATGIVEGPEVGRVLRAVEDWWIEEDFPDDHDRLTAKLRDLTEN